MTSGSSPDNCALWTKIASIILLVGSWVAIGFLISSWIGLANLAFIFLIPVVAISGRLGTGAGLLSAGVATLAFNFFFVPPTWTLHVASVDNVVTLTMFAGTAIVVSQFAARLKAQAVRAERLAKDSALLAQLSADLSGAKDQPAIAQILVSRLAQWSGAHVQLISPNAEENAEQNLGPMDRSAALWTISHGVAAGRGSDVLAGADSLYLPMDVGDDKSWLVQFWRGDTQAPLPLEHMSLVSQAIARGGDALRRSKVIQHQSELEARQQQDEMREALLASISHDLRTPLTGIRAGLDALKPDPAGILESTRAEAARLERMVTNLLDLARLKANALSMVSEAIDLTDVIDAAIVAMSARLDGHPLTVSIDEDLPLVHSDSRLLHHMLINLIENACKYSADGVPISIMAKRSGSYLILSIADGGPGLPEQTGRDIFSLFQRGANVGRVPGTGLGLAVVDGFARALRLAVTAENRCEQDKTLSGAIFTIHFPEPLLSSEKE